MSAECLHIFEQERINICGDGNWNEMRCERLQDRLKATTFCHYSAVIRELMCVSERFVSIWQASITMKWVCSTWKWKISLREIKKVFKLWTDDCSSFSNTNNNRYMQFYITLHRIPCMWTFCFYFHWLLEHLIICRVCSRVPADELLRSRAKTNHSFGSAGKPLSPVLWGWHSSVANGKNLQMLRMSSTR